MATDSPDPSGVGRHMLTLARALPPGWRARLVFPDHDAGRSLAAEGRRLGVAAATAAGGRWRHALAGADLVHVHAGICWEGHGLAGVTDAPVVRTEHLPWLITCPQQRADYARMVARLDAVITVSRAAADSWRPVLATMGGPRVPMACIPNGIEAGPGADRPARRQRFSAQARGDVVRARPRQAHDADAAQPHFAVRHQAMEALRRHFHEVFALDPQHRGTQ